MNHCKGKKILSQIGTIYINKQVGHNWIEGLQRKLFIFQLQKARQIILIIKKN